MAKKRKMFCEYGPVCYAISVEKERLRRHVSDLVRRVPLAKTRGELLPEIWKGHSSVLVRALHGVDMDLQRSKVKNLYLAGRRLDGLVIAPGEVFSFWHAIGRCTKRRGYQPGMTLQSGGVGAAVGGGLCQMANLVHYMVLHSPLQVEELHHHTDALFPDSGRRVPFGTGTSVFYNHVDYRFRNTTDTPVQLHIWQDDTFLYGELRAAAPLSVRYRLEEQDHHFACEDGVWYRNSRVVRYATDADGHETQEVILINHSRVMYDPALIPPEQIREVHA